MANAPEQSKYAFTTLSKMKQFHLDGKFWDVQLEVDTRLFKCQRSLLAANSEYFYTMFSSEFEESNTTKDEPISLHQMDSTAFEEMLHFMYTGEIQVDESNVLQLLFLNDFLQLYTSHVKEQCLEHVKSRSQEDEPMSNAIDLLCFAHFKGENVLVRTLHAHIGRHLYHYSKDARLMTSSFDTFNALLEFSKNYIVPLRGSADVLFKIIRRWVNHSREERSQYRSLLMKNVDMAHVSSKFALSVINKIQNAVDEAVHLSKDIESLSELKMLVMEIDTNLTDGDTQFDGETIEFNFKNMSKMQTDKLAFSSSRIISGLRWKIGVERDREDYLSMYLFCDGTSLMSVWNCYARAIFTIVPHKEGRESFVNRLSYTLFRSVEKSIGFGPQQHSLMKWKVMNDPENGFIKEDSITLHVHVYADVPFLKIN